jgi:hypothetical protein
LTHYKIATCTLKDANQFVETLHRHHKAVVGHKFSLKLVNKKGTVIGVVIVGRPVARRLDNGTTVEVTRLVTDGSPNACSALYGAASRAATHLGYDKIITYILESEPGTSLKASGWEFTGTTPGKTWSVPSRPREDKHPTVPKQRWEKQLKKE